LNRQREDDRAQHKGKKKNEGEKELCMGGGVFSPPSGTECFFQGEKREGDKFQGGKG